MLILGIETSCDETAVALVREERGVFSVIDELISSQIKVHSAYGGVVPNLAAREHLKNLPLLLKKILRRSKVRRKDIDMISVTQGPGLIPALLIGTNCARALSYAWKKPLVGTHHIEGHIYANLIRRNSKLKSQKLKQKKFYFPILALMVSGGHTELVFMKRHLHYKIVGQTLDDAAGEAFDKAAKILHLGYPGGPIISKYAQEYKKTAKHKIFDTKYKLPRPMINSKNSDFSFSGLKTALLYTIRDNPAILKDKKLTAEICFEFQQAIIDVLVRKTIQSAQKLRPKTILLGGGVSANRELRKQLEMSVKEQLPNTKLEIPDAGYSLDNAAMIAVAANFRYRMTKNKKAFLKNWKNLEADAGLRLKNLRLK